METNDVGSIMAVIDSLRAYLENAIDGLKAEIRINAVRIEEVRSTVNMDFMTLAIVVAVVGLAMAFAPMLRDMYSRKDKPMTAEDVRNIVRDEFAKLSIKQDNPA